MIIIYHVPPQQMVRDLLAAASRRIRNPSESRQGAARVTRTRPYIQSYCRAVLFFCCLLILVSPAHAQTWLPAKSLDARTKAKKRVMARTLSMTPRVMKIEYALPDLEVARAGNGTRLTAGQREATAHPVRPMIGNTPHRSSPGLPILPVMPARLVLPAGHELDAIRVTPGREKVLPGSYQVVHGQASYPLRPGVRPQKTEKNRAVYESDTPYPDKLFEIAGIYKKQGVSLLLVNLHPVIYRPQSGRLAWYDTMTVTVTTRPPAGARPKAKSLPYKPAAAGLLEDAVENPEMLDSYTGTTDTGLPTVNNQALPRSAARYVLVTSQAIIDDTTISPTVADFIAHRQGQGLSTAVVSMESILAEPAYLGRDDAETLRNFIIDAYTRWNTEYVLLGGDTNIVPLRKLWCRAGAHTEEIPSDLYYQCLDGDFNSDGDNYWGEPTDGEDFSDVDLMAEIYVGRASAENATELANFFYKTMAYENSAADASYLTTALMAGEWLGFGGISEYASPELEEIRLGSSNHDYTTAGFAAFPNFTVDTLYDSDTYEWPASVLIDDIDSDVYGMIVHDGHGLPDQIMKLYNADADALANTNFILGYSQACLSGAFDTDCIAEHLTTSTRHGMFAVVYNAREGWGMPDSTDSSSQRLARQFWDACFGEYLPDLGAINTDSHEDNLWDISDGYVRWCIYGSNLLGDPCTVLRGRPALALQIPASATEGDGLLAAAGTVSTDEAVAFDLTISLASSDTTEATVPPAVVLPAGAAQVSFDLTVPDDLAFDGAQTIRITADAEGFMTADRPITIADTDSDTDGDGLADELEWISCADPDDADTDDDGILDGEEDINANGQVDEGETGPCQADTDGDGIQDGTERGYTSGDPIDTNPDLFQPDLDPDTTTDPLNTDTDGDGLADGQEDTDRNGRVDAGETDPDVNVPPTVDAGDNQTVTEGDRVVLDGTGSFDIDDGIASYTWTQTSDPEAAISDARSARTFFTAPAVTDDQSLVFRLRVTDQAGQSSSDSCIVRVQADKTALTKEEPADDSDGGGGGGGGGCFLETVR